MSELSAEGVLSNPFCVGCIAQINFLVGNETFVGDISVLIEFAVALHAGCWLSAVQSGEAGPDRVLSGRIQVDEIVTNISTCTLLSFRS